MTTINDRNGLMNHKFDQTKYVTMQNKPILVNAERYNQLLEAERQLGEAQMEIKRLQEQIEQDEEDRRWAHFGEDL